MAAREALPMLETDSRSSAESGLLRERQAERAADAPREAITLNIAFVNNMPKSAFEAAERQFFRRLKSAPGVVVRLRRFVFAKEHGGELPAGYRGLEDLWATPMDGLVVTGSEPREARITQESYWGPLADLISWAQENTRSSVWSCLSAQAVALRLDGLERRPLGFKRSGVFRCKVVASHPLVDGWTQPYSAPHSRLNELREEDLRASGYRILTHSPEAGADVALRPGRGALVLLQGHPEYDAASLLLEYRRDLKRWFAGASTFTPAPPQNYFTPTAQAAIETAVAMRRERALEDMLLNRRILAPAEWSAWSSFLFGRWLGHIAELKMERQSRIGAAAPRRS